jgi:hypothetical protein
MNHLDIIFKAKTNKTKSDQELSKGKRKKEEEEDSRIGEVHDKFLIKGIKILKTLIKQSLSIPETKEISITWLEYATFLVEE